MSQHKINSQEKQVPVSKMNEDILKNILEKWVSRVIDKESIIKKLTSGKKLRIKFGIDPTAPIIHIGHAVPFLKLRMLQELGHHVILLIGDATAQVGDSSDKDSERPMLTREQTRKNADMYVQKFSRILHPEKLEIYFNSEGLDKINFAGVGELAKNFSVAEMLDRDNFPKRYKSGKRISLQEFLYPLMQGYDSVAIRADIELGGNDQYFNLLAGRRLQEAYHQEKQDIIMMNLIEGSDGRKMSKSWGNCILIDEEPNKMFVQIMEVTDTLITKYFEHCTLLSLNEVQEYKRRLEEWAHPRDVKLELAHEIVTLYHGKEKARLAKKYFEQVLTHGESPNSEDIEIVKLPKNTYFLVTLLSQAKFVNNSTEARNAIQSWGVKVDGKNIQDTKHKISLTSDTKILIQVGKKKFKYICGNRGKGKRSIIQ